MTTNFGTPLILSSGYSTHSTVALVISKVGSYLVVRLIPLKPLPDLFEQQKEDAQARFQLVASGLVRKHCWLRNTKLTYSLVLQQFKYIHDSTELWSTPSLLVDHVPRVILEEELQTDVSLEELEKALNKPLRTESPYKTLGYQSPELFAFVSDESEKKPL